MISAFANVSTLTYRAYPYIPLFWYDQERHLRCTLTVSQSAVLSAFLSPLIAYALGSLLVISYTLFYLFFLSRKTETLIDDQVITIGTNSDNPFALLGFLFHFVFRVGRRARTSTVFRVLFLVGIIYCIIELLSLALVGNLVLKGPVPISSGTCGQPIQPANLSGLNPQGYLNSGIWDQHALNLLDQAASQFLDCTDNNNTIGCPGPAGQTFSWDVVESEPDYCWFGSRYCYNGSRTISQRATVVPSDLGTVRHSSMSLTMEFECSHVNNSEFAAIGWDPRMNSTFYAYKYGTSPMYSEYSYFDNVTYIAYPIDEWADTYDVGVARFNLVQDGWNPPVFLLDALDTPFITDNTTANSTLYLIFNRLFSVWSADRNNDPLFLTQATPNSVGFYEPLRRVSTMACRDRFELKINDTWTIAGDWNDMANTLGSVDMPNVDLNMDKLLLLSGVLQSAFGAAYYGLGGNLLNAEKTVTQGLQNGNPPNISTRGEVTRWFGITVLYTLNMAKLFTSGTDNDWGFGIEKFPDQFWICGKTLRIDPLYVSVYVAPLLIILFGSGLVVLISTFFDSLLLFLPRIVSKAKTDWIRRAIVVKNSHQVLQLHRIGVELTTEQRFKETTDGIPVFKGPGSGEAPKYVSGRIHSEMMKHDDSEDGRRLLSDILHTHAV